VITVSPKSKLNSDYQFAILSFWLSIFGHQFAISGFRFSIFGR
jgi:hypothetical protein